MFFDDIPYNASSPSAAPLTLSELGGLVREVIELSMPDDYWVTAELASVRENHGHCYMELVEKDDRTHTPRQGPAVGVTPGSVCLPVSPH